MIKQMFPSLIGIVGLALSTGGCATEPSEPDTEAATAAVTVCREVQHFAWVRNGVVTNFDVTTELETGRQFVDERRIGGPDVQYTVSPVWSYCPHANEQVRLKHGATIITGSHNCLPDGRQEYHGSDAIGQRLLVPRVPAVTYNCDL